MNQLLAVNPSFVSVIIPSYNGERDIVQAIESVLNQTYTNYEIIVVNDGSTDNTRAVLSPYFNRIRYIEQENQGVAAARNRGIREAKGELIAFLDQDDYFLPEKLAAQVAVFEAKPWLGIVNSGWRTVTQAGEILGDIALWQDIPKLDVETWFLWKPIFPGALMFRKEWLERAGGFDTTFHHAPDLDLVLRLALMGCQADWANLVTVCYRQHDRNVSLDMPEQARELEAVLDRVFAKPDLPADVRHLESQCRYYSMLWLAGRLYDTGYPAQMAQYLQKSLTYTPHSLQKTILEWLELFQKIFQDYGRQLDIAALRNLPEWQQLIKKISANVNPRVSVIIPTYNNAHYIKQAIKSVVEQTYQDYEIIVIDDGSTDETRQILEPYFDVIRYTYQQNQGLSAARNSGLSMARGELIALLDGDDFFLPHKLTEQVACFDTNPSVGIVHSGWYLVDESGERLTEVELWKGLPKLDLEAWLLWRPLLPGAMMFRREWLQRVGGFNPQIKFAEDVEIALRLALMGCEAVWLKNITVCYRQHGNTITAKNTPKNAKIFEKIYDDFFARPDLPARIRQLEKPARYNYLVWLAWRLYLTGYPAQMLEYLQKSLAYTPYSPTATIADWVKIFRESAEFSTGKPLDTEALGKVPGWKSLVQSLAAIKEQPRVSVIIPSYNCERYIVEAVGSVLAQTYSDYEIIVVDDGSTDNTRQALTVFEDLIHYVYQENQGVSAARNRGIHEAKGEFVALLDSDDYFLPHKLAVQVACFEENPALGIVNSGWRLVSQKREWISDIQLWQHGTQLDLETWVLWKPVLPSAMMFRRDWLERVGGFDLRFPPVEDIDLVLRLAVMGCEAAWATQTTVCYRQHDRNASRGTLYQAKQLDAVLDNFFARPDLPIFIRRLEKQSRYQSLVWNAWRFYDSGDFANMAEYLQKSLGCTPLLPLATVADWAKTFWEISLSYGYKADLESLFQAPEWKELLAPILPPRKPRVSVIIPVYNCERYIWQAIDSVLNQTYLDWEILIIDDGSTDRTRQRVAVYGDLIRYFYQENQGVSATRNRGIQEAQGELIAFLDADDFFLPDKLAEQVACFDAEPSLGIVNSGWRTVNQEGSKILDVEMWKNCPCLDLEAWIVWKPVLPSAMMFKKKWLEVGGGFNQELSAVEDIDLVLRMVLRGCQATWLPKVTVCYRLHDRSATAQNVFKLAQSFEAVYDRLFSRQSLPVWVREFEPEARYKYLLWLAWHFYQAGHFDQTVEYLRKSLSYTQYSGVETIYNWMAYFDGYSLAYGYKLDTYSLSNSADWKQLVEEVMSEMNTITLRAMLVVAPQPQLKGPRVSVIIPTYNCERYIAQAVESVLNQSYQDYEIIVVDDGSTDNTRQVLTPYDRLIRYVYQENQGAAIARNHGCKLAQGEFLAFLDADDLFLPEKLAAQVACFEADPSLELVQTGWRLVNERGEKISDVSIWEYAPDLSLEAWVLYKMVRPSAMMLRREWWEKVGGFDHRYPPTEDLDFVLRLSLMGCKATWLREIHTCYRQHGSNLMSGGYQVMKNTEIIMEEFFSRPELPTAIHQLKRKERYQCYVWMAWRMYANGHLNLMAECLDKSLAYTALAGTETVANWIDTFSRISVEYGLNFEVTSLMQLPEWQRLVRKASHQSLLSQDTEATRFLKAAGFLAATPTNRSWRRHILLYNTDEPGVGGLAQYDHAIICRLASLGYRVTVARPKHSSPFVEREKELGIEQVWLDFSGATEFSRTLRNQGDAETLFSQVKPDLIIFSDGWPIANFAAKQVAVRLGIPYLITLGLAQPEHGKFTQGDGVDYVGVNRLLLQHAKVVIAAAHEHLQILQKQFKLPTEKGQVIYYGRSEKYFAPPDRSSRQRLRREVGIPEDGVVCFTSARLAAIKGHRYQLAAIKQLQKLPIWSRFYFVWAGTGQGSYDNVEAELKATVRELGVSDRVKFLGQRWDIIDWLDASDIFVLTSLAEAAPSFAVMEAMAKGLPVVASAAGGIPEGLGDTGQLLPDPNVNPEGTVRELVKTLEAWVANPELRRRVGTACKQRAEELFKEERMLQESVEAIEKVLRSATETEPSSFHLPAATESRLRYSFLVWQAWEAYCQGDRQRMVERLRESGQRSPFLGTETVLNWVASFTKFAEEKGVEVDTYSLIDSVEWKQLIEGTVSWEMALS
ncbi:MAG: glycosyltransferase [Actinomycetota bacterium]